MRKTIALGSLTLAITVIIATMANASDCKGLQEQACTASSSCRWIPARVAGETKTKAGNLAKTSAKAHCRLGGRTAVAGAAQN